MLIGGLMLLLGLSAGAVPARWPQWTSHRSMAIRSRIELASAIPIVAGLLVLTWLILADVNTSELRLSYHFQFVLLGSGIVLLTWGLAGLRLRKVWHRIVQWVMTLDRHQEWIPIALITGLAFVLQIWMLGQAVHTFVDEFHDVQAVIDLWQRSDINILTPYSGFAAFPWVYPYLAAGSVAVFGPTLSGLRFVSVICGTLTVPALYMLAKHLFDRWTALIAALLLATFPPFIHLNRLALINVVDPFVGTLMLALFARGLQTKRRTDFVLSGACLGLTQYFYEGGKLLYPTLLSLWVVVLLHIRTKAVIHS